VQNAVLHGYRSRQEIFIEAALKRVTSADPDRHRADSVGKVGALDAGEAVRHAHPRRRSSSGWRRRGTPRPRACGSASSCCSSSRRFPAWRRARHGADELLRHPA
jgi:hypothetical protein